MNVQVIFNSCMFSWEINVPRQQRVLAMQYKKKTPWPESASGLYQPSVRRLSRNLVPTFEDRGVSRSQRGGSPTAVF
jgi:hypothetical protein